MKHRDRVARYLATMFHPSRAVTCMGFAVVAACGSPSSPTAPASPTPPLSTTSPDAAAAAPTPATPASPQRRVEERGELESWMLPLPKHGLFHASMGLGGHAIIVVDRDTLELSTRVHLIGSSRVKPMTKKLAAADVDRLWKLAEIAWRAPPPEFDQVTDYREVVLALDDDQVMIVSVHGPMEAKEPAAALALALRKTAGPDW